MQNPVEMMPYQTLAFRQGAPFGKVTEQFDSSENALRLEVIEMLEFKINLQLTGTQ